MTKEEFLSRLGLSSHEFRELVRKFIHFLDRLTEAERAAVLRSMPTIAEAARSFGPDVTSDELGNILKEILEGIDIVALGCHSFGEMNPNP
jgi:hypothetical protein